MGERAFSKIQYGLEETHGTPVAADTMVLAAPVTVDPDRTVNFPEDMLGVRAKSSRSAIYEYLVRNSLVFGAEQPPYFQILPWLFSCGLKGNVTPVEQNTSQSDYLWTFTPNMGASNTPDSSTLEVGDNTQAFCFRHFFDIFN